MNLYSDLSESKLMILYQNGDTAAFEEIYRRSRAKVYTYLRKRVPDGYQVDEIHQNIYLRLHNNRHKYSDRYHFYKWLFTISRWELLDFLKQRNIESIPLEDFEGAIEDPNPDLAIDIQNSKTHTDKEKSALLLKYFSQADYDEISQKLGLTPSNTRKVVSRGISKLRRILQEDGHE